MKKFTLCFFLVVFSNSFLFADNFTEKGIKNFLRYLKQKESKFEGKKDGVLYSLWLNVEDEEHTNNLRDGKVAIIDFYVIQNLHLSGNMPKIQKGKCFVEVEITEKLKYPYFKITSVYISSSSILLVEPSIIKNFIKNYTKSVNAIDNFDLDLKPKNDEQLLCDNSSIKSTQSSFPLKMSSKNRLPGAHYLTTEIILSKSGRLDITTVTETSNDFMGFTGGVQIFLFDKGGNVIHSSAIYKYGVDGTWIPSLPSKRRDHKLENVSNPSRATSASIVHFRAERNRIYDWIKTAKKIKKELSEF